MADPRKKRPEPRLVPLVISALLLCAATAVRAADEPPTPEAVTAQDQSENVEDRRITQEVRKSVMASETLPFLSKNVVIVTVDGAVTLRGRVETEAERAEIETIAKAAAPGGVRNEIEVANP